MDTNVIYNRLQEPNCELEINTLLFLSPVRTEVNTNYMTVPCQDENINKAFQVNKE